MRAKGIAYDTGFIYQGSVYRERFDPAVVSRELAIIRDDLHCVAVELIRNADVAGQYRDGVRSLVAGGKPVAITGFAASAYAGAAGRGARAMEIVEYDEATQTPLRLDGEYARDEEGQAAAITEVLDIFLEEGVDSAFVWLFELCNFPHRPGGDPRDDLDLASPAIVRTLEGGHGDTYPGMTWEPKAAFTAIAGCYRSGS
jgi:hypothetical protein